MLAGTAKELPAYFIILGLKISLPGMKSQLIQKKFFCVSANKKCIQLIVSPSVIGSVTKSEGREVKMRLTKYEKETIILFNESEDAASVYTYNAG